MLLSEAIRQYRCFVCPRCGGPGLILLDLLEHMRADHMMTNARIADWVAEQEKRLGIAEPTNVE